MSRYVIHSAYKQAFYRVRAAGEHLDFWQPDPAQATKYPSKADADKAIESICSRLTRHMTYAVTEAEARALAVGPIDAQEGVRA